MPKSAVAVLVLVVLGVAGCGSGSSSSSSAAANASAPSSSATGSASTGSSGVALSARKIGSLGTVLVNGQGRTLYIFAPDRDRSVTCVESCAQVWPPVAIAAGQKPAVSGGVSPSLISSDPNPAGGRVLTYAGWPLYRFQGDSVAGSAQGQALNLSGGVWYVITPAGKVITTKPPRPPDTGAATDGY